MDRIIHEINRTFDNYAPWQALFIIYVFSNSLLSERIVGHPKTRTNKGELMTIFYCLIGSALIAYLFYLNRYPIKPGLVFVVFTSVSLATAFSIYKDKK